MKVREYNKKLSVKKESDLHKDLATEREALRDLRFKASQSQLKEVRKMRVTRKSIARILTALHSQKQVSEKQTNNN